MTFQREDRYIVIKRGDLNQLSYTEQRVFGAQCRALHERMYKAGAPARQFLVIESDWPEYEPAWAMIEARVSGKPLPQSEREAALQQRLNEADQRVDELRGQIAKLNEEAEFCDKVGQGIEDGLRAKLDTAIGLLRHIDSDMPHSFREGWKSEVHAFLNTTSTEGKHHE